MTAEHDSPATDTSVVNDQTSQKRTRHTLAKKDITSSKPSPSKSVSKRKTQTSASDSPATADSGTAASSRGKRSSRSRKMANAISDAEKGGSGTAVPTLAGADGKSPTAAPARSEMPDAVTPEAATEHKPVSRTKSRSSRKKAIQTSSERDGANQNVHSETPDVEAAFHEEKESRDEAVAGLSSASTFRDGPSGEKLLHTVDQTILPGEQASPAEYAEHPSSTEMSEDTFGSGESPRRKSRRGRRGGRGRNRKKVEAESLDNTAEVTSVKDGEEERKQKKDDQGVPVADENTQRVKRSEVVKPRRRMFISVLPGEEVEVALTEDGQVLEYYLDMLHQRKLKGNIYKGVIHNIDTNLQAAFVSYGLGKNGFLQIDEVHPEYWLTYHDPSKGKKFPPIQKILKAGQEVLVQVVKEPTGNKGAFLTTWLSLAGRFLVLTPGQEQIGVSRKVEDEAERTRLREMMNGIEPGQGLGVIVRTVSAGTTKTTLKNDLQYLKRLWRDIRKKGTEVQAPALIYQEPSLSDRAVRDYLTEDVAEIWVDNEETAQSIRETVNLLFPRKKDLVHLHADMRTSMWERFNLRRQLEQIYAREVLLPSGGRLVFDQTEALMAIDINSGKISGKANFESMAHKTNMEAAEAIARHLKLRDIGGQVVIDFIEMRDKNHIAEVEKTLRLAMKNDRARHDVAHMSSFGLLELVRQRTGSSALSNSLEPCPACSGTGMRRNIEWQALQALRELRGLMSAETRDKHVYTAAPELALYLLNHKRDSLREIERDYGKCLEIVVRP